MKRKFSKEQIERKLEALARTSGEVLNDVQGNLGLGRFVCGNKVYLRAQELNQEYVKLTGNENLHYTRYGVNALLIKDEMNYNSEMKGGLD